jgi:hypothetical protein
MDRIDWLANREKDPLRHAGQAGDDQGLSDLADSTTQSVEDLSDTEQQLEASRVEGVENAADHPERPTHTHEEYPHPEELPPRRRSR